MKQISRWALIAAAAAAMTACSNDDANPSKPIDPIEPIEPEQPEYQPGQTPDFRYRIAEWDGTVADDIAADVTDPADEDSYWENNQWEQVVTVTYTGTTATVTGHKSPVRFTTDGAHVNLSLGGVKARVIATGESADGSLRITGEKRHMLTLSALNLKSSRGPAINDQNKKRVFLNLEGDSYLEDAPEYAPAASADEDRKGCFFAEGHVIMSGSGVLHITGRQRHSLATDGYLMIRPGVTIVVNDAAKNAISAKGGNTTGYGIIMRGGYIYANTSAPAGKVLKSDLLIDIQGGTLDLNCSGDPAIDPDDNTLSSAACIKGGADVIIRSGSHTMTATGHGGKGINATGAIIVSGATTTIACAGDRLEDSNDSSTPKGVKTDSNLSVLGGTLNVSAIGSGSIGVEVNGIASQQHGIVYTFGVADAWRTTTAAEIVEGTFIAGGATLSTPKASGLNSYQESGLDVKAPTRIVLVTTNPEDTKVYATFKWPVAVSPATFYFTSPDLEEGNDYEIVTIEDSTDK